jgi:hypothetical protein
MMDLSYEEIIQLEYLLKRGAKVYALDGLFCGRIETIWLDDHITFIDKRDKYKIERKKK